MQPIPSGRPAEPTARESELEAVVQEQARTIADLRREVARLQAGASAVHGAAMQARRAMTEVEERAANAALPWRRRGP